MATKNDPPAAAKNQGTGASASIDPQQGANVQPTTAAQSTTEPGLNIPTLGQRPAAQPVLQEGEDPSALAGAQDGGQNQQQPENSEPQTLADLQKVMDARDRPQQAMHRPTVIRQERFQTADTAPISMEMPITGNIDNMRRPDQFVEPVPDMATFEDHAAALAFLEEPMIIRIHATGDPNAENPVVLGVNGRQVVIWRDQDTIVRRKYVEQLLRSKPESVSTRLVRTGDGDVKNMIDKTRALKHPFSILRDDNPLGRAWERRIRAEA